MVAPPLTPRSPHRPSPLDGNKKTRKRQMRRTAFGVLLYPSHSQAAHLLCPRSRLRRVRRDDFERSYGRTDSLNFPLLSPGEEPAPTAALRCAPAAVAAQAGRCCTREARAVCCWGWVPLAKEPQQDRVPAWIRCWGVRAHLFPASSSSIARSLVLAVSAGEPAEDGAQGARRQQQQEQPRPRKKWICCRPLGMKTRRCQILLVKMRAKARERLLFCSGLGRVCMGRRLCVAPGAGIASRPARLGCLPLVTPSARCFRPRCHTPLAGRGRAPPSPLALRLRRLPRVSYREMANGGGAVAAAAAADEEPSSNIQRPRRRRRERQQGRRLRRQAAEAHQQRWRRREAQQEAARGRRRQ